MAGRRRNHRAKPRGGIAVLLLAAACASLPDPVRLLGPASGDTHPGTAEAEGTPGPAAHGPPPPPLWRWTKTGLTALPPPVCEAWPRPPWFLAPWGPVPLRPGPLPDQAPPLALGFPTADGTPVVHATWQAFLRRRAGVAAVWLFDFLTRALLQPPNTDRLPQIAEIAQRDRVLVISGPDRSDPVRLFDLLTGAYDPLPEVVGSITDDALSRDAEFIFYTDPGGAQPGVRLFDRRQRLVDPLARLNRLGRMAAGGIDAYGRELAATWQHGNHLDVVLYDTLTGLIDVLPEVNTGANEFSPRLDDSGRFLIYLTSAPGRLEVRLFDRLHRAIDPLPEANTLAPITQLDITPDGLILVLGHPVAGRQHAALYLRPSGILDLLPEVNLPDADVDF